MFRRITHVLIGCLIAIGTVGSSQMIHAHFLYPGESINYPDGNVTSDDFAFRLGFGYTSNWGGSAYLVHTYYGSPGWDSLTDGYNTAGYGSHINQFAGVGTTGSYAVMQYDGNFVLSSAGGEVPGWMTGTYSNPGAYLNVQGDGNIVVRSESGAPLWSLWGRP